MRAITQLISLSAIISSISAEFQPFPPPETAQGVIANETFAAEATWSNLLGDLIWFYEAQRSGNLPADNRVSWRNSSGLQDGQTANIDLTGGYYDAGDYIKATYPFAFVMASISWGVLDNGVGYDNSDQTVYIDKMLRWGFDWLMKACPEDGSIVAGVSDVGIDNNYWGGDQGFPEPRPVSFVNVSSPGTDLASIVSAAFAAGSLLYNSTKSQILGNNGTIGLHDDTYSTSLLRYATSTYKFAVETKPYTIYTASAPALADAYGSSTFGDDLTFASQWMYLATGEESYYDAALSQYSEYKLSGSRRVFNWDSKTPGIFVLFAQISSLVRSSENITGWQFENEAYFDDVIDQKSTSSHSLTNGGLLFYEGDSDSNSLNPSLNAAMLLYRYSQFASESSKTSDYINFADGQVNYALGANPRNIPYVVGLHPNSPKNPHSAAASGGSDIDDIDGSPLTEAYVLFGGVVGGPSKNDDFADQRSDYIQNEIALDYNSPLLTIVANQILRSQSQPYYATITQERNLSSANGGLSTGAKIGIAVGAVLITCIIAAVIFYFVRRKKTNS